MRKINECIIHCTAINKDLSIEDIRKMHVGQGRDDCGYHYLVRHSGTIEVGRPLWIMGAHCRGHNKNSIGIAFNGLNEFYEEQFQSAASLIFDLQQIFGDLKISPHNKYSNKRCPVFDVSIIKGLIDGMEKLRTSYME